LGDGLLRANWAMRVLILFFLGLAFLIFRATGREIARNKAIPHQTGTTKPVIETPAEEAFPAFQASSRAGDGPTVRMMVVDERQDQTIDPTWIRLDVADGYDAGEDAEVLKRCKELSERPMDPKWDAAVLEREIFGMIQGGNRAAWQAALEEFPSRIVDADVAVPILNRLAAEGIRESLPELCQACLPLVRKYGEARPADFSLVGTLAGLLAVIGERQEARRVLEQLMRRCTYLTDLSITSLLLAEVALQEGGKREAAKLARKATDLADYEWVVRRAQAVLEGIATTPAEKANSV
jgi:hypothetical protein